MNEVLWFKKGQEVDELMGISLDPDITIQEYADHVSVRGVIELAGEYYQQDGVPEDSQQVLSLRDHASKRSIQDIRTHDDGISEFTYQFPVEITIPLNRVASLDDVRVSIDSFDYELPESTQLKLQATVAIHGVENEAEEENEPREIEDESTESLLAESEVGETFEFDVKHEDSSDLIEESLHSNEITHREESIELEETPANVGVNEDEDEEPKELDSAEPTGLDSEETETEKDRWKYKKSQTFTEFFGKKEQDEEDFVPSSDESYEESSEYESSFEVDSESSSEPILNMNESPEVVDETGEKRQDAAYLTNMFNNAEDQIAQMRMCIVQNDDTIETIAERYSLSITQITRANKLEDDYVASGQILYIPNNK